MIRAMSHLSTALSSFKLSITNLSVNLYSLISPGHSILQSFPRGCSFRLYALVATMIQRIVIILGCFPPDQAAYCAAEVNQHTLYSKKYSKTSDLVIQGSSVVVLDKRYQLFTRYNQTNLFSFSYLPKKRKF
jgi:hypothetical protein